MNFWLTNRIPRRTATRLVAWLAGVEHPLVVRACLFVWRRFTELDLTEAERQDFVSLRDCFTRRLKSGARPFVDGPTAIASPCDAIVGACGRVEHGQVLQVKGMPYALADLLCDPDHAEHFRNGCYVTLRLTSSMYHRFHSPDDLVVRRVTRVAGDRWNVNPPALARVQHLYCRNARAVIETRLAATGIALTLVPVAAILVGGIRLAFLDLPEPTPDTPVARHDCDAALARGDEMGWFEHGSTIVVFAAPGTILADDIAPGRTIRAGQPLLSVSDR